MNNDFRNWYLDYNEKEQQWHIDLERLPENDGWTNIGYAYDMVLTHFCDVIDMMEREFGLKFSATQINRLAECTPGLTVFRPTPIPGDPEKEDRYMAPIWSREEIEKNIGWKQVED